MIDRTTPDTLTGHQRALRDLAVRQLAAAQGTLRRLQTATTDQGDREAVSDAMDSTATATEILCEWFGREPE